MEAETMLAGNLRRYNQQSSYDHAAKRLLSDRRVLARILKACVKEFEECDVDTIAAEYIKGPVEVETVPILPDETNARMEKEAASGKTSKKKLSDLPPQIESVGTEQKTGTESATVYDIRFYATAPGIREMIWLIIVIEAQNRFSLKSLIKRGVFENCRQISSQYGPIFTHSDYGKIRKVYTIFICTTPTKRYRNTITRYRMREEHILGQVKTPENLYDLTTLVLVCLGDPEGEGYGQGGFLKMLDVLLSNKMDYTVKEQILETEYDLPMTEEMKKEALQMCNLGQGIAEENLRKGIKQGLEQGMKKGREEGREEGSINTFINNLRSLMKSMKWSIDQAMTALDVPESDRPKYRELLGQQ